MTRSADTELLDDGETMLPICRHSLPLLTKEGVGEWCIVVWKTFAFSAGHFQCPVVTSKQNVVPREMNFYLQNAVMPAEIRQALQVRKLNRPNGNRALSGGVGDGFVGAFHEAGLASRRLIAVDDAALRCLVDGFAGKSDRLSRLSDFGRRCVDCDTRFLDEGLERRLGGYVTQMVLARLDDVFFNGFDIRHEAFLFVWWVTR